VLLLHIFGGFVKVQIKMLDTSGAGGTSDSCNCSCTCTSISGTLPAFATENSAGMDLCTTNVEDVIMQPGERKLFPLGFSIALPNGVEAQIRSRSGLSSKFGICVLNAPGTIDSDYRGEVCVLLANFGQEAFVVTKGMRVAQMVIARYEHVEWDVVQNLDETKRNSGGFGSTGA
jgi:dUTP pyrophosphatase